MVTEARGPRVTSRESNICGTLGGRCLVTAHLVTAREQSAPVLTAVEREMQMSTQLREASRADMPSVFGFMDDVDPHVRPGARSRDPSGEIDAAFLHQGRIGLEAHGRTRRPLVSHRCEVGDGYAVLIALCPRHCRAVDWCGRATYSVRPRPRFPVEDDHRAGSARRGCQRIGDLRWPPRAS